MYYLELPSGSAFALAMVLHFGNLRTDQDTGLSVQRVKYALNVAMDADTTEAGKSNKELCGWEESYDPDMAVLMENYAPVPRNCATTKVILCLHIEEGPAEKLTQILSSYNAFPTADAWTTILLQRLKGWPAKEYEVKP